MKNKHLQIQPRLIGHRRKPMGTAVIKEIESKIKREMDRYNVSRSFVIACALAYVFKVDEQPDYK